MKIALINENSQAAKNKLILDALEKMELAERQEEESYEAEYGQEPYEDDEDWYGEADSDE